MSDVQSDTTLDVGDQITHEWIRSISCSHHGSSCGDGCIHRKRKAVVLWHQKKLADKGRTCAQGFRGCLNQGYHAHLGH